MNMKLKMVLLQRGLTQRELAFQTRIDEGRVSKIIHGYEKPTSEMKEVIAEFLKMPEQELFEGGRA